MLRHDTTEVGANTIEINRNLHNFGVKLGASLSRSSGEEVEDGIHWVVGS